MQDWLHQFAQSETGWWVAICMLAYGASDSTIGLWWLRRHPDFAVNYPRLMRAFPWLMALDVALVVAGLWLLWQRSVEFPAVPVL